MTPQAATRRSNILIAHVERVVDQFTLTLSSIGIVAFSAIVVYVALGRYVFGRTPFWSEELPRSLLVWTIFIGVVPVTIRGSHLNAGLLPLLVHNTKILAALSILRRLLTSLFFSIVAYTGWQLTEAGRDSLTTALQMPNAVVYVALPIGCGLAAVASLLPLLKGRSQ